MDHSAFLLSPNGLALRALLDQDHTANTLALRLDRNARNTRRALEALLDEDYATRVDVRTGGRPAHEYAITDKGRAALLSLAGVGL